MAINYDPLKSYMHEHKISWYKLADFGISGETIQRLRGNQNVTLTTINKICFLLDCTPSDIIGYTRDEKL